MGTDFTPFPNGGPPRINRIERDVSGDEAYNFGGSGREVRSFSNFVAEKPLEGMVGYSRRRGDRVKTRTKTGPYVPYAEPRPVTAKRAASTKSLRSRSARSTKSARSASRASRSSVSPTSEPLATRTPSVSPLGWSHNTVRNGIFGYTSSLAPNTARRPRSPSPKWNYSNRTPGIFEYVCSLEPNKNSYPSQSFRTRSASRDVPKGRSWKPDNRPKGLFHYESCLR
eukprot:TRINITY_DN555_c0_g1_i1.p1 TRINITY_DN555_c0_g1~~TRINITY_DN555_c0_g1_i1.p1  ORF type:complete len:226 (+),score=10.91 TRINITY_DN555_c0_g1_i1:427-1104(+)